VSVAAGRILSQYRLTDKIGEGGMGQVWRAVDTGLDREVAVKILPDAFAADADRLARFEREAKAVAALAHPNILSVFGFGKDGATRYMVTELLEGQTLRERLAGGPLPPRRAAELARQVARGLAAAHEKGIAHRDLKPDNVFVTREGRAKILDFGLASATNAAPPAAPGDTHTPTATGLTTPGAAVGTPEYMSPEQVRGEAIDHRTDIFSFGTLLYEMLTGLRPFRRETTPETMTAVLREDPPDPAAAGAPPMPPALERVVRRCLEKRPEERFQSASDLAFAVDNALGSTSTASGEHRAARAAASRLPWLAAAALPVLAALGFLAGRMTGAPALPQPEYSQLTFRQGRISAARFAPEGGTVVYSAAWDGGQTRLYSVHEGSPESRSLGIDDVEILSVSAQGELALLLRPRILGGWMVAGTLARLPLGGGAPRELMEDVGSADWDGSGQQLAVTRAEDSWFRLEYPPGSVLYQTTGWISNVRFSPDGHHIAFTDHESRGDDGGFVAVVGLDGNARQIGDRWSSIQGLAWSSTGDEILFTGGVRGTIKELRAVDLDGNVRLISSAPVDLRVHDVSRNGRVLVSRNTPARRIVGRAPDAAQEIGLSWLDWSYPTDITSDGSRVLFTEQGEGGGSLYSTYIRTTDGGPAILLGDGQAWGFSPDETRVVSSLLGGSTRDLMIYPVGPGQPRRIELAGFRGLRAFWLSDEGRMLLVGSRDGEPYRVYLFDITSAEIRPVSPGNVIERNVVAHAGSGRFTARVGTGPLQILSIHGEEPIVLADLVPPWRPYGFDTDGEAIYGGLVGQAPLAIERCRIATGECQKIWEFMPAEPAGLIEIDPVALTPDGRGYVYSYRQLLSTLYVVDGL
jgi:hypothetical protein